LAATGSAAGKRKGMVRSPFTARLWNPATSIFIMRKNSGFDKVHDYALMFGLGEATGVGFGKERKGLIPNTEWKRKERKEPWWPGETVINSIRTGLCGHNTCPDGGHDKRRFKRRQRLQASIVKVSEPVLVRKAAVKPETLELVKKALEGVVNEPGGTGPPAHSNTVVIGGKTGTAQVVGIKKDSNTWQNSIGTMPGSLHSLLSKTKVAVSVLVEHGGTAAAQQPRSPSRRLRHICFL